MSMVQCNPCPCNHSPSGQGSVNPAVNWGFENQNCN
jgi:hypothetical protein